MAEPPPRKLIRTCADDLVGVHVGLRAAPGLEYDQREVVIQRSGGDLVARLPDDGQLLLGHAGGAKLPVCQRGGFLEQAEGVNNLGRHPLTDAKIVQTALCLRTPVAVCGHLYLAHGIVFGTGLHGVFLSFLRDGHLRDCHIV